MIVDLTIGFNELDIFRIRYHELKDIVDRFVVLEATHTHSGKPKELYFSDWLHDVRIGQIHGELPARGDNIIDTSAIEIIIWDNGPEFAPLHNDFSWIRENAQREMLGTYIRENLNPYDLCMLSDMDEIPRASALDDWIFSKEANLNVPGSVWRFAQTLSYLYFNTSAGIWNGTKLFEAGLLDNMHSPRPMTDLIRYRPEGLISGTIDNGGWHFSSCGGVEKVREKFDSYAHTEMQHKTNQDIAASLEHAKDPFHGTPLTIEPISKLPQYVIDNLDHFKSKGYIYGD